MKKRKKLWIGVVVSCEGMLFENHNLGGWGNLGFFVFWTKSLALDFLASKTLNARKGNKEGNQHIIDWEGILPTISHALASLVVKARYSW